MSQGVTCRLTGYVCALSQFFDADDMKAVSQLCRQDFDAANVIHQLSESLLHPKTGPRVPLMNVLRGDTKYPVCCAYAQTVSLRLISRFLRKHKLLCGVDHGAWFSGLTMNPRRRPAWNSFHVATSPWTPDLCVWWKQTKMDIALKESDALNRRFRKSCHQYCVRTTLHVLVDTGLVNNYVYIERGEEMEPVVTLWFALGVAPTIPLECEDDIPADKYTYDPRIMIR